MAEEKIPVVLDKTYLKPLLDFVVVQPLEPGDRTDGGIIMPQKRDEIVRGVVLAVGPGGMMSSGARIEPTLKRGDFVHFLTGQEVYEGNKKHYYVREIGCFGTQHSEPIER